MTRSDAPTPPPRREAPPLAERGSLTPQNTPKTPPAPTNLVPLTPKPPAPPKK